ncbi:MAG: hypothetical protein IKN98_03870 [Bacteroidales bacterium]|nr:hypothetical protein [Bacteroidales bacterium]
MSYFTANMENRTDKQKGKEKPLFKHKTALILTVLTMVLWVTFATFRLLLPKFTHLAYMGDGWLLIAATILTSVMCACWFHILSKPWHPVVKVVLWIVYPVLTLFWLFCILFGYGYLERDILTDRSIKATNDEHYVLHRNFDGTVNLTSLYHRQGFLEKEVCWLDFYSPYTSKETLQVYEDLDVIVFEYFDDYSKQGQKDLYHFNGDLFEGAARDSVLRLLPPRKSE